MYLRRVEAQGFKSFADRQVFEFGPGITAVVGPNGSGKSNVSDAVRWALGEQSARAIRARRSEDFIFSGSDARNPQGMAEVTLSLDNSEHWMPIDYNEVTVTRRTYRSGESEYRINGQKVRLLDVQDLFRRAQVGQNSYAMMSQGLVDEVLGLRPIERRRLIEEAAEVHRHRIELTRAERRLGQTRDNLGHVRVLIRELAPRLRQLERQSTRAARYRELEAELGAVLETYYETELARARDEHAAAQARHDQRTEAFAAARRGSEALAPRIAAAEQAVTAARAELERTQRHERELSERALALDQQLALSEQRRELLEVRREELAVAIADIEALPAVELDDEPLTTALDARVTEAETGLGGARAALTDADETVREALRELTALETRRARTQAEIAGLERRREQDAERRATRARQREAAAARRGDLLDGVEAYGREALAAKRERERLMHASAELQRRRMAAEERLENAQTSVADARDTLRERTAERDRLIARRDLIAALSARINERGAAGDELMRAAEEPEAGEEPLKGVVGLLTRMIRVPSGLERAIEAALADQIGAVIVETPDDALAAIEHLRKREVGAATLLPVRGVRHQHPLNLLTERGVVGVASRLVRADKEYRPLVDSLLGRTIVVDDIKTALRHLDRGLGSIVTRDGILLRPNGAIHGGSRGATADQFELHDEAETLPEEIAAAERAVDDASARIDRLDGTVLELRESVRKTRRDAESAEERQRDHERAASQLRGRLVALGGELRLIHAALAADEAERDEPAADEAPLRAELADIDRRLQALRDRSDAVGAERDAAAEAVAAATTTLATALGEREAATSRREAAEAERRLARERLAERREQAQAVEHELEDLVLAIQDLSEQRSNVRAAQRSAEAAVSPAHAALADAEGASRTLTAARGDSQAHLFAAERDLLEAEATLRECAGRVQTLEQQLTEDGMAVDDSGAVRRVPAHANGDREPDAEPEPVLAHRANGAPPPPSGGADVSAEELRTRVAELRGELRALGPVNLEAIEDLTEERERHDFLVGQVSDLEAAEEQLREAITDLERRIRERFDETFELVNASFGEYFQRFFGGGSAELTLVEPVLDDESDDPGDPGVEVRAQPPGKRISSLAMLSGGERALTSVALLFALLSVNPAPVCVLDEVDAALDDANVGRFVQTLREMSDRSQFIVITHNRGTIEAADAIYGVSMGDDSASRVLSLRLADLPQAS
ncbi:MAG: chromosome segregation protein SMC [Chloroflexi bacterium]|nr:chromosome segregation protein SMC [Chloroflexota bacterium]